MINRSDETTVVARLLRQFPVVALLGPRQVGKTTLARQVASVWRGPVTHFDLEQPSAIAQLTDSELALAPLKGLVVLDEVQRRPEIFPVLRVLADRTGRPARFLVLGSAAPELLKQTSESLAGRIAFHELGGFSLDEIDRKHVDRLWLRGGYPLSFTARSDEASLDWRRNFVRTYLERDLPQLGISVPAQTLRRLWTMLAHCHGQVLNWSELGRSMSVADNTVRRYVDHLAQTFMVELLPPWFKNISKRQVKAPKLYLKDSGILHALLDQETAPGLLSHPKVGASWEGFALGAVSQHLGMRPEQRYFWATHQGAELDLLFVDGNRKRGFEFKRTVAPAVTPSMRTALETLKLDHLAVVHAGAKSFPLGPRITAVALSRLREDLNR